MPLSRRQFLRTAAYGLGGAALAGRALARTMKGGIDPSTLHGKVLCGYQGWFRCPGDGTNSGWRHWSRDSSRIAPDTLTFDMWPDMSEYSAQEQYPAPGFTYPDGSQAYLFSSANPLTVNRHFGWMQDYGIDGVLVQRFVVGLADPPSASLVLANARDAANQTGRVFAVEYDMSGTPTDQILSRLTNDWRWLVEQMGIIYDPRYLYQDGLPVVAVWGFFQDRFDSDLAQRIIDFFMNGDYPVFLIGGCQWWWRSVTDPGWAAAFRRFNAISPWNVGNVAIRNGRKYASTGSWAQDLAEAQQYGMLYLPVIYPGFSWDNLQRLPPGTSLVPRLYGDFIWDQFDQVANNLGNDMAKVAMFDEVDESTAIFKVTNSPPTQGYFVTYEGLHTDWYLWLTGDGTQLIRGY